MNLESNFADVEICKKLDELLPNYDNTSLWYRGTNEPYVNLSGYSNDAICGAWSIGELMACLFPGASLSKVSDVWSVHYSTPCSYANSTSGIVANLVSNDFKLANALANLLYYLLRSGDISTAEAYTRI